MANNPNKRTDELMQAVATHFRNLSYVDGDFIHEHRVTADECFSLFSVLADMIEGIIALPYKNQMLIRLAGGEGAMPAEKVLYAWMRLYADEQTGLAADKIGEAVEAMNTRNQASK